MSDDKRRKALKALAVGAETVSFLFREADKTFQADALKDGKVLTYNGEFPRDVNLLKIWLARELGVAEDKVFEGVNIFTSSVPRFLHHSSFE